MRPRVTTLEPRSTAADRDADFLTALLIADTLGDHGAARVPADQQDDDSLRPGGGQFGGAGASGEYPEPQVHAEPAHHEPSHESHSDHSSSSYDSGSSDSGSSGGGDGGGGGGGD